MKAVISVIGRFHSFDLARELHSRGALQAIFSGYPRFKLRGEGLPPEMVRTFPYVQTPFMALPVRRILGRGLTRAWERLAVLSLDNHVARRLPECDLFIGLSSCGLRTASVAKQRGARYVCDRGSTHIRTQDRLLREEHERWGMPYDGIDPQVIEREEAEYAAADLITVPSSFTLETFIAQGVPASRLRRLPYGVNLSRFHPVEAPPQGRFDVLFVGGMSLRKGVPYLLQAYARLTHPRKSLSFAGAIDPGLVQQLKQRGLWPDEARLLGHVPQPELKALMSRSHVMVLPSVEEGLALVQAQAMACGCVVLASRHTGAEDLFSDGEEGFIVPVRDADALAGRLQQLADDPALRQSMSTRAVARVRQAGGWQDYGTRALAVYQELLA
jgi:glycosyltransferase involved in cell wall biosynthesis